MPKYRAGLHRKISSIFDGVPIHKDNGAQQPPHAPIPERPKYEPDHKRPPALQEPDKGHLEGTPAPPEPSAPSHLISLPTTRPDQPEQPPPKATPTKQPKADTATKTARQIQWRQTLEQIKNKLFEPKPGVSAARQKTIVISVPVLFIVLIFVFIRVFSTPSRQTTKFPSLGPANAAAASKDKIDWQIPEPYPTTLRDPTRFGPVSIAQAGTGRLIVKGIVYSEDNPSAVIGTQIVCEGDKILGATVVKINKDSVEFEMDDKGWTQRVQR